ncbi:MAG: substrate-binding domain-containing protein [Succinivibrionaceae bacterium]|nr:substrate-binding domain-containing protein [Succinivibrionaceae bacterium]
MPAQPTPAIPRFLLSAALALALAPLPSPALGADATRVDYIASDGGDYFVHQLSLALQSAFAGGGYSLMVHDSQLDPGTQSGHLRDCATASEGPIIITPVDDNSATLAGDEDGQPILAARGLIIYGSVPGNRPQNAWYISSNPYSIGERQAQYLVGYLTGHAGADRNRDGTYRVILLNGELSNLNAEGRRQGFLDGMGAQQGIRYEVEELNAGWDGMMAEKLVREALSVDPEGIEVVVAANDEMALGAVRALKAAGFNHPGGGAAVIPVLGVDGMPAMLSAIAFGEATATLRHDLAQTAEATLSLYNILRSGIFPAPGEVGLRLDQENQVLWLPEPEPIDAQGSHPLP